MPNQPSTTVRSYARLQALPPASIAPAGWLGRYTRLNAGAWLRTYACNKDPEVYGKFWHRNPSARVTFDENNVTQVLCDYTAYFADGLLRYATLLPEAEISREAEPWIEQLLASQDDDGYLGAFEPSARWQHWLEVFSQGLTLEALLYRYEATGEERLLEACERAAGPQMHAWYRPEENTTGAAGSIPGFQAAGSVNLGIFSGHGTIVIRSLLKLYALTANAGYLGFARDVMARYGRTEDFLHQKDAIAHQHNAVGTEHISFPALLYEYAGDPALLEASRAAWQMLVDTHLSVDGTPHGNESMEFKGPLHNCEHCGTVEWFYTSHALARITGEVKYADAAERAMLNAYPAAKSVDGMTVAYMHTPNQLVASEWSQPHAWTSPDWCASRQHYHSAQEPLCCNVNGPRALPYYVESMVLRAGQGLAVIYYGAYEAHATLPGVGPVTLQVESDYPFEDDVRIAVCPESAAEFPLQFRIPGWCSAARVTVNEQAIATPAAPGTYARIDRTWQPGDRVAIHFECPVTFEKWERGEFGVRSGAVVVKRGALTFTLPVAEDWQPFTPPAHGPGQNIVAYRVLPRPDAAWNYALVLDPAHPEQSFNLVHLPAPAESRPWEHSPIGLQVKARRVLNWQLVGELDHPQTPLMPFNPLRLSDEETIITLVPFGFTHLRMTYLPVVP
jgi:uncharacterized protein